MNLPGNFNDESYSLMCVCKGIRICALTVLGIFYFISVKRFRVRITICVRVKNKITGTVKLGLWFNPTFPGRGVTWHPFTVNGNKLAYRTKLT